MIILTATRKPNRTPDYLFILPEDRDRVTRLEGSIAAVLDAGTSVPVPGRTRIRVSRVLTGQRRLP